MEKLTEVSITAESLRKLALGAWLAPADLCCNCGGREGLSSVGMLLPNADLTGEAALSLHLPHCTRCVVTARRIPPRFGRALRLFPLSFLVSAFVVAGVMSLAGRPPGHDETETAVALATMTLLGVFVPWLLFRWRPPSLPGQTSRYQAVRVKVEQSFLGKVKAIRFAFTNPAYAERFRAAAGPATE